jgi:hypothetical protein
MKLGVSAWAAIGSRPSASSSTGRIRGTSPPTARVGRSIGDWGVAGRGDPDRADVPPVRCGRNLAHRRRQQRLHPGRVPGPDREERAVREPDSGRAGTSRPGFAAESDALGDAALSRPLPAASPFPRRLEVDDLLFELRVDGAGLASPGRRTYGSSYGWGPSRAAARSCGTPRTSDEIDRGLPSWGAAT